jgi:peptide/nickel transport system substrate-binding protein
MRNCLLATAAAVLALAGGPSARAAEIAVASAAAPSSADPHFHEVNPNNMLAWHVFGSLTRTDPKGAIEPGLATSWDVKGDQDWVFHLRDAKFHDGSPFTANDVVYTLCRMQKAVGPTQSFTQAPKSVAMVEAPDPHTVVLHTHKPDPTLPALPLPASPSSRRTRRAPRATSALIRPRNAGCPCRPRPSSTNSR